MSHSPPPLPTIFALDDDPLILRALEAGLWELGEVQTASLWSEISQSLITASQAGPVVLVCDLEMPNMAGLDFCAIVRRFAPQVRIVIFSGAVERTPGVLAVADQAVPKSAGIPGLKAAVRVELDRLRAQALLSPSSDFAPNPA